MNKKKKTPAKPRARKVQRRNTGPKPEHQRRLLHSTYFRLKDRSQTSCAAYIAACIRFLSISKGITGFWVGQLGEDFRRPVNDLTFDVAMHIEFENFAAWLAYNDDPNHHQFVQAVGSLAASRRVFDIYLEK